MMDLDFSWRLIFALLAIPVVCSALGAKAQYDRGGQPILGAVVGFFFGPLGVIIAMYTGGRICPGCRNRLPHRAAIKCARCGTEVRASERPSWNAGASMVEDVGGVDKMLWVVGLGIAAFGTFVLLRGWWK